MPPGRCRCKYCNPGRGKFSQNKLNKELKEGYLAAIDGRKREEYQAPRDRRPYIPNDQPLVNVFLKTAPAPRKVLRGSNSHEK